MGRMILLLFALLLLVYSSCKKVEATPPAVVARIYSVSYPPDGDNYIIHTSVVELKKTDGSFSEKQYLTGSGALRFEALSPGEYWINEETTRQSDKFILGTDETRTIDFSVP